MSKRKKKKNVAVRTRQGSKKVVSGEKKSPIDEISPPKKTSAKYAARKKRQAEEKYEQLSQKLTAASVAVLTVITVMSAAAISVKAMTAPPEYGVETLTEITAMLRADKSADTVTAVDEEEARLAELAEKDVEAPVIYGVGTIYVTLGESPAYLSGVYAQDDRDQSPKLTYDPSSVNIYNIGTYSVEYFAEDESGNVSHELGNVIVSSVGQDKVDAAADEVLSAILTDGMTDRQKAEAIYNWCVGNIRYSSYTGYLIGCYSDGAYTGFKYRSGNCYVYYSTSSVLLWRAGIENQMIRRNSDSDPHYWNLVKIDGEWYHFDTCPHYRDYPIRVFLLTDKEVREYSEKQVKGYYDFDESLYPKTP